VATYGEMINAVLTAAKLRPDTDRASVKRVIVDAEQDVALETELNQRVKTATLNAGQADYSIRTDFGINDFGSLITITGPADTVNNPILEATYPTRLLAYRDLNTAIQPQGPIQYALYGRDTVMFYPTPSSLTGITVYYVNEPTSLFDDSDTPDWLPSSFHRVIEDRATEFAAARWGRNSQLAADANARYRAGLGDLRKWLNMRNGTTSQTIRTASSLTPYRWRPHDRSTDTGW
jgi:hypothetical protein